VEVSDPQAVSESLDFLEDNFKELFKHWIASNILLKNCLNKWNGFQQDHIEIIFEYIPFKSRQII
jgi:hypothetical protein